jgi:hypothetical protein
MVLQLIMLGGGAFCNGQKIHASQTDRVRDHVLIKIKILDFHTSHLELLLNSASILAEA